MRLQKKVQEIDMFERFDQIEGRYEELSELLSDPQVISDTNRFLQLSKEEADLRDTVAAYKKYKVVIEELEETKELLGESMDKDMEELVKEEFKSLNESKDEIEEELKILLLPKMMQMNVTSLWRFAVQLVEMKHNYLPLTCTICIKDMLIPKDGRQKSWMQT